MRLAERGLMGDYEGVRRLVYGERGGSEYAGAVFVPVCPQCGRFVKADDAITFCEGAVKPQPNATCKRCGRVAMIFEGFYG